MQYFFRRLTFTFLLVFLFFTLNAQIKIGALGGLNMSSLFGDGPQNGHYESKPGLYSGVQFDIDVHKNVAISIQPAFSKEGAGLKYNVKGVSHLVDSGKINFQYIRIPVLAKISSNNKRLYAIAGFDFGTLGKATLKLNNQEEDDISNRISKNDFSFHTGIGYRWHLNAFTLFLEGRYTLGMENLTNDLEEELNYFPRVKNSSLKILLGLEIALWNPDKPNK